MSNNTFSFNLETINNIAKRILNNVEHKTILFYGEMGVGKTTLIKSLLKQLGSEDKVSSPTFSIVNAYNILNDNVFHFDLYRIEAIEEALDFGIEDYLFNDNWVFIEWPQIIEDLLPKQVTKIHIAFESESKRRIKITY